MRTYRVVYEHICETVEARNRIEAIILVLARLGIVDWEPVPLDRFEAIELS